MNENRVRELVEQLRVAVGDSIAYLRKSAPAEHDDVFYVLAGEHSEWRWFATEDGSLVLGTFPQAETYEHVSDRAWEAVNRSAEPSRRRPLAPTRKA